MRLAFIGAGRAADKHHAAAIAHPEVEFVGFVEPVAARREARTAQWGVRGHADMSALAAAGGADALVVMVPPAMTAAVMDGAVELAPAILLEKPIATTLEEADAIRDIAARAGAMVLMGHNGLHHPGFVAAREAIAAGAIGTVTAGTAEGAGWLPLPEGDFRRRADLTGGGVWMDMGSHLIYSLTAVMGPVAEVQGLLAHLARKDMEGDDHAVVSLRFASGGLASLQASYARKRPGWAADWPEGMFLEITYWGTKGALRYQLCPSVSILIADGDGRPDEAWRPLSPPTPFQDSFDRQLEHFVDCAAGRAEPAVSIAHAREVLSILLAVGSPKGSAS